MVVNPWAYGVYCGAPGTPDDSPSPPPPGPHDHPSTDYLVVKVGPEYLELLDDSLSPEKYKERVLALVAVAQRVSQQTYANTLIDCVMSQGQVGPPTDVDGTPLPPPMKLPNTPEGFPNDWIPVPGTPSRPIKWKPRFPVPGGSQPGGSWDPENGHWDVDSGRGVRVRQSPDGTPVDHYNNPLCPPPSVPDPFADFNYVPVALTVGVIAVVVIVICVAPEAAPMLLPVVVAELG